MQGMNSSILPCYLFFSRKQGSKCHANSLFLGKNKKNIIILSPPEFVQKYNNTASDHVFAYICTGTEGACTQSAPVHCTSTEGTCTKGAPGTFLSKNFCYSDIFYLHFQETRGDRVLTPYNIEQALDAR